MQPMTDDYARKLNELDRLLNDPDVPLQPELVWRLVDEVSEQSPTILRGGEQRFPGFG
jgi:hypothetical protein